MPTGENPYRRFAGQVRILRDELAIDRTILANERTYLAYIRTALAFGIVAVTCFKFFDSVLADALGCVFVCTALFVFGLGTIRTHAAARRMAVVREHSDTDPQAKEESGGDAPPDLD